MKRSAALAALTILVCVLACAQEAAGHRVVVPARNTSRPRMVNASLTNGSITVKTHTGGDTIVETGGRTRNRAPAAPPGMKRLDTPDGLDVVEQDNVITVRTPGVPHADLVITVPADTSLTLKSTNGSISVDGVRGEIDASSNNGQLTFTNVSGTVVAHSLNGEIKAVLNAVDAGKPLSFSTLNGAIDVTLPADVKASVKFKADRGEIYSDFEIALTGQAVVERNGSTGGPYRLRIDRNIQGTINGGGVEASFYTLNGRITLRKK